MAREPHLASEAVLCGPQGFFARLISSLKGLLSIFWQIKRSKPKPYMHLTRALPVISI